MSGALHSDVSVADLQSGAESAIGMLQEGSGRLVQRVGRHAQQQAELRGKALHGKRHHLPAVPRALRVIMIMSDAEQPLNDDTRLCIWSRNTRGLQIWS
jgi:hypothetical protein